MEQGNTNKLAQVVLADDHNIVRHAIKTILEKRDRFSVIAEADTADLAIQHCEEKKPDILILDIGLPGKSGIEAIFELRDKNINTKIVVLTMFEDEAKVRQAILAGANGYIFKKDSPDEFIRALDKVLSGDLYLPEVFEYLRDDIKSSANGASVRDEADPLQKLSKREREVFYLLADGMPNRVIAKQLFISPRTVETHRARVIKKLGFSSTADLIRYAIRNNLLTL